MGVAATFAHDEARRLYATGEWTQVALGRRFGVSPTRIGQVVNPQVAARMRSYLSAYQKTTCSVCGGPASYNATRNKTAKPRCSQCAGLARVTTAREGELRCSSCGEWKPDEDFPRNASVSAGRRHRHKLCRSCGVRVRSAYRAAHREDDRAYQRKRRNGLRGVLVSECGPDGRCRHCGAAGHRAYGASQKHCVSCPLARRPSRRRGRLQPTPPTPNRPVPA